jgi:hypothetical protein
MKNRKNFIWGVVLAMVFIPCAAFGETLSVDREVLEKILKRQDELEKEVKQLKEQLNQQIQQKEDAPAIGKDIEYLKEDVAEQAERLDVVEKKSLLDRVSIDGELRARVDFYDIENMINKGQEQDTHLNEMWNTRLRLNLRSEITKDLIFYGRLSYLKYWGNTSSYDPEFNDRNYFIMPDSEGDLHVERAYVDYFVPGTPVALTIGRLPVSGGPPYEFKNDTTRKATWPQMFVDAEMDGIIGSLKLDQWTGWENSMLRVAYSKVTQNYAGYLGDNEDSVRAYTLSLETEFPGIKDSLLWLGVYVAPDVGPLRIAGLSSPPDAGSMENYTLHMQFDNILGTGLGWFGALSYQNLHPRSEGTMLAPGYEVGLFGDSLHGDLGERQDAYGIYTGLRYVMPIEALKHPQIGFEYNYGSQYWFPASIAGDMFTQKLMVTGSAYELYYIQPVVDKHVFCRVGAIYTDFDYYNPMQIYGSMDAAQVETDMSIFNTYFLVDVRF